MDNNKQSIEKEYKTIILNFINDSGIPNKAYDEYVSLLSLFLSKWDPNYKYNYTYLKDMNKELCDFLSIAREKMENLKNINNVILKEFDKLKVDTSNICIYMDNFFEIKNNTINLIDYYSIMDLKNPTYNSKITIMKVDKEEKIKLITLSISDIVNNQINKIDKIIKDVFK